MSEQPVFQSVAEHYIGRLRWATAIAYLAAFFLLTLTVAYGISELRVAHSHLESVMARHASKAQVLTTTQVASFRRAEAVQLLILETDAFARDEVYMDYLKFGFQVGDGRNKTRALLSSDEERAVMQRQDRIVDAAVILHDDIADLARTGQQDVAMRLFIDQVATLHDAGHQTFQALRELHAQAAEQAIRNANDAYRKTFNNTLANMLLGLIVAIGIGVLSHRVGDRISRRLRDNVSNLRHLALHDSLTGLLNRTAFNQLLEHKFEQGGWFALLYMDLDGLKQVNDAHGHDVGDQFLMMAAARIRSRVRGVDVVARFGGDEFVALLQDVSDTDECTHAARHILESFDQLLVHDGVEADIGVSIGIAIAPIHGRTAAHLLSAADRAMYLAKDHGSNHFEISRPAVELAVNNGVAS